MSDFKCWSHHCSFLSCIILAFCFFGILPYLTESRLMPTSMHFLNLQNWHLFLFILNILHVPFFGHWRYASWLLIVLRKNPWKLIWKLISDSLANRNVEGEKFNNGLGLYMYDPRKRTELNLERLTQYCWHWPIDICTAFLISNA